MVLHKMGMLSMSKVITTLFKNLRTGKSVLVFFLNPMFNGHIIFYIAEGLLGTKQLHRNINPQGEKYSCTNQPSCFAYLIGSLLSLSSPPAQ